MPGFIVVLWRVIACALWLSAWGSSCLVSAKGVIAFPPAQYLSPDDSASAPSLSGKLRGAASSTQQVSSLSGGAHKRSSEGVISKQIARKKAEFDKTASSSMKKLVDESIPDCGTSRIDITPVDVTHAGRFEWRNLDAFDGPSKGPCEIWIDSERVFEHQNCVKLFETVPSMKFDYTACRGTCLLTFYWLLVDREGNGAEPMKHCVPIQNGPMSDSSSKSGSGSQSASAPGSSSGSGSSSSSASSSSSGSGSGSDTSSCIFDFDDLQDLHTLSELYGKTFGFEHHRSASKSDTGHHEMMDPHWYRPHFALAHHFRGYTATHTKTATEQCQYTAAGGFTCSNTETSTDSVQPLPGVDAALVHSSDAEEHLTDLQNLHETHF